jgi:hypothetical protein
MAGRGPLNYTTTIEPAKSAAECVSMLARHGAAAIGITYNRDRDPSGLTFQIETTWGMRQFSLPVNVGGTEKAMLNAYRKGQVPRRYTGHDQARRVSWRVLKDWLEAQLALIEAGVADLAQVMLPYVHIEKGRTLWEMYQENETRALEAGTGRS